MTTFNAEIPDLSGMFIRENYSDMVKRNIFSKMPGWLQKINPEIAKKSQSTSEDSESKTQEFDVDLAT